MDAFPSYEQHAVSGFLSRSPSYHGGQIPCDWDVILPSEDQWEATGSSWQPTATLGAKGDGNLESQELSHPCGNNDGFFGVAIVEPATHRAAPT